MFALTDGDLGKAILSAADGPASFNAEVTRRGGQVVSVDPLYAFSAAEIRARVQATADEMVALTERERHRFVWRHVRSPAELRQLRLAAMETFLADYPAGLAAGRYRPQSLPRLDFADDAFGLAVCSHFLFLYSAAFDADFHVAAIRELLRVAPEARVFPLLDMTGKRSAHLDGVAAALRDAGLLVTIERVPYEFQRGGDEMLRVRRGARSDDGRLP
jgi:hypothetical protein